MILDDLDKICPVEAEYSDSSKTRAVTSLLLELLKKFSKGVSVIGTARDEDTIHKWLQESHIFLDVERVIAPTKDQRRALLRGIVSDSSIDLTSTVLATEGYTAGDITTLMSRARQSVLIRTNGETAALEEIDLVKARDGFVPSNLQGIKMEKGHVKWTEVGGMETVKDLLLETLDWPTKYAPIFASCPLRLRSGILLYGYPGTGKTFISSAIAGRTGLNFISVKGPELLNKYIGASEKAVREVFEKALNAKPCILFFDEFESIAPRRGNDNTGVTDRIVNQLLTLLDGAEGLSGVYVLAATRYDNFFVERFAGRL